MDGFGNARSGTSEKCCSCYLKRGIFIRVVNVEMKKWRERERKREREKERGEEFVTRLLDCKSFASFF